MITARVRISLATGELEIEGSEDFVANFDSDVEALLAKLTTGAVPAATPPPPPSGSTNGAAVAAAAAPSGAPAAPAGDLPPFGELLNNLPKEAYDTDRILLAGLYAQRKSTDGTFTTGDASSLLVEQGVKLSNPSQAMKGNSEAKRAFRVGKRNWKVGKPGEERLAQLGVTL